MKEAKIIVNIDVRWYWTGGAWGGGGGRMKSIIMLCHSIII